MTTNFNVLKVMQLKNNNKNENMPEIIQFNIDKLHKDKEDEAKYEGLKFG